jgi:hypothetical protein
MKILVIILCVVAAILYIVGTAVWFTVCREDTDMSPWAMILTTIFWPVILVFGIVAILVVYLLGLIVSVFYEFYRNIFK